MSNLIRTKTETGDTVYINLDHVLYIAASANAEGVSKLTMSNGVYFNVQIDIEKVGGRIPHLFSFL